VVPQPVMLFSALSALSLRTLRLKAFAESREPRAKSREPEPQHCMLK